jgi:hypothetical protein
MRTGRAWVDIKSWIDEEELPKLKAMIEDWFPKGNEWSEKVPVGTKEWDGDASFKGLYDTVASGPDEEFFEDAAALGEICQIAESFDGGTKYMVFYCILMDYQPEPKQGGKTRFNLTLAPYGEPYFVTTEPTGSSFITASS